MKINLYLGVNEPFETPNLPSSGRVTQQVRGEVTEREALTQSVPGMNHPQICCWKRKSFLGLCIWRSRPSKSEVEQRELECRNQALLPASAHGSSHGQVGCENHYFWVYRTVILILHCKEPWEQHATQALHLEESEDRAFKIFQWYQDYV